MLQRLNALEDQPDFNRCYICLSVCIDQSSILNARLLFKVMILSLELMDSYGRTLMQFFALK